MTDYRDKQLAERKKIFVPQVVYFRCKMLLAGATNLSMN